MNKIINMENIGHRLEKIAKENRYSQRGFDAELGKSPGYIAQVKSQSSNINSDVILEIMKKYPEVNIHWLLTGEGEMLEEPQIIPYQDSNSSTTAAEEISGYQKNSAIEHLKNKHKENSIDDIITRRIESITRPLEEKVNTLMKLAKTSGTQDA